MDKKCVIVRKDLQLCDKKIEIIADSHINLVFEQQQNRRLKDKNQARQHPVPVLFDCTHHASLIHCRYDQILI